MGTSISSAECWPVVPLEAVAPIVRRPVAAEVDQAYPIIAARSFGRGTFHQPTLEGERVTWQRLFQVRAGDLLVSNIKAWEGAVALVPDADDGMYCSHRYLTCVADVGKVLPAWLGLFFKTPKAVEQLAAASPGSADRNRTLSMDGLRSVKIPLPPLDEQRRIVARIDALADKIAEARKLGEATAADTTGLLVAMAHRNDLSRDAKIRDGWRPVELGEIIDVFSDPHPVRPDLSYPNFGIYSFGRGLFAKAPISGLETSAQRLYRARAGLFIYSRLFAFEGAYGLVDDEFDGFFVSNEYPMFACKVDRVRPEFLAAYFRAPGIWRSIAEGSSGLGDRRQRVQPAQLLRHQLLLPPMEWQQKIADVRRGVTAYAAVHSDTVPQLDALLPAILDRAFKGEL